MKKFTSFKQPLSINTGYPSSDEVCESFEKRKSEDKQKEIIIPNGYLRIEQNRAFQDAAGLECFTLRVNDNFESIRDLFKRAVNDTRDEFNSTFQTYPLDLHTDINGTTFLATLVADEHLYGACIGDSRVDLFVKKNGVWKKENIPSPSHTCKNANEAERVTKLTGIKSPLKIIADQQGLMVTRSLGDFSFKKRGSIDDPEYFEVDLREYDDWVLFTSSDGLDYVMSDERNDVIQLLNREEKIIHSSELLKDIVDTIVEIYLDKVWNQIKNENGWFLNRTSLAESVRQTVDDMSIVATAKTLIPKNNILFSVVCDGHGYDDISASRSSLSLNSRAKQMADFAVELFFDNVKKQLAAAMNFTENKDGLNTDLKVPEANLDSNKERKDLSRTDSDESEASSGSKNDFNQNISSQFTDAFDKFCQDNLADDEETKSAVNDHKDQLISSCPSLIEHMSFFIAFLNDEIKKQEQGSQIIFKLFFELIKIQHLNTDDIFNHEQKIARIRSYYKDVIEHFKEDTQKLKSNVERDKYDHFENLVTEIIIQSTQPMVNCLIDNLKKHETKLRAEAGTKTDIKKENPRLEPGPEMKTISSATTAKAEEMKNLISDLEIKKQNLYNAEPIYGDYESASRINLTHNFFNDITRDISQKEKALSIHRKIWKPIIGTVLVALTGVGLFAVIGKAIYGAATNTSPLFFTPTSQKIAKEVNNDLQKFGEDVSIVLKKDHPPAPLRAQ